MITHTHRRTLASITAASALLVGVAAPTAAAEAAQACPDDAVTVVVDATELGGDISIGCADGATTGAEALAAAGFDDTRDDAGMICAIGGLPEPCPTEFTGVYWSYWYGEDGTWQMWLEGPDTAELAAGSVEGWRYGDGTEEPGADPGGLAATDAADAADEPAAGAAEALSPAATGLPNWAVLAVGLVVVAGVAVLIVRLTRRGDPSGPAGQD